MPHDFTRPLIASVFAGQPTDDHCASAAARAGWQWLRLDAQAVWTAVPVPALVMADQDATAAFVKVRDARAPGVGVVAVADLHVAFADETVPPDAPDASLDALLARWRPLPLPTTVARQLDAFGPAHVLPLLTRLRERMVASVSPHRSVTATDAHQLAGIAGILGFAEVGAAWEAVSCGGESCLADARRMTRRAIAALDRSGICASQP